MDKHLTLPQNLQAGGIAFLFGILFAMPTLLSFSLLRPAAGPGELAFVAATPLFLLYLLAQIAARILPEPKMSKPAGERTGWTYAVGITGLTGIASAVMALTTLASIPLYWKSDVDSAVVTGLILALISVGIGIVLIATSICLVLLQRRMELQKSLQKPWRSKQIAAKRENSMPRARSVVYSTFFYCFMRLSIIH